MSREREEQTQHPFLSNLGIPVLQQARKPTIEGFPLAFNQNNRLAWAQAVTESEVTNNSILDWSVAIRRYVDLCMVHDLFPFQNVSQSRNDQISTYLTERRRAFVKFVNLTDLFGNLFIKSTTREVKVTDKGFVLTVNADVNVKDPTFVEWLKRTPYPKFQLDTLNGHYRRQLMDGLTLFAYNDYSRSMDQRWHLGYEIVCPIFPDLPTNQLPSKAEIEKFVLDILWRPVMMSARPLKTLRRLI